MKRRSDALPLVLLATAGWTLVAVVMLFELRIFTWLFVFGYLVLGLAYLAAAICTVVAVAGLWRRAGPRWAVPVLVACLLAPAGIYATDWVYAFATGYYRAFRHDFATVAAMSSRGEVNPREYYGDPLPRAVRHLSVNGRVAHIVALDHDSGATFLPQWEGVPDGAVGFAYLDPGTPPDAELDCFADQCRVRYTLGDGWYWLTRG
ncbi:hypothetical protein [Dactylosporangium sp. CS-033363]|uniref:hypothetical protein n=1 Tax=Dactylosporangium sp. CS-033363 TaxID=3239935 RepID=UPI003D9469DA